MTEVGSLTGVTFLHSPDTLALDTLPQFDKDSGTVPRILAFTAAEQHIMKLARARGAAVLCATETDPYPTGQAVYWQNRAYDAAHAVTQALIAENRHHIPDMPRQNIGELTDVGREAAYAKLAAGEPLFLAYLPLDNGHIKYLLEYEDQLERFLDFIDQSRGRVNPRNFELRPFIETPSGHYTSFRFVVDATGSLIAAGIHYSSHTKTGPLRNVAMDRFSDSRPTTVVRSIKEALENPASRFFLNARDVRSNSSCGGKIIALMGENRKPPSEQEVAILEAHEIDPADVRPPRELARVAQYIGRTIGPHTHLLLGIDSVGPFYSETNIAPGGGVYAACHMRGGGTMRERYIAMREQALANIARQHNPSPSS